MNTEGTTNTIPVKRSSTAAGFPIHGPATKIPRFQVLMGTKYAEQINALSLSYAQKLKLKAQLDQFEPTELLEKWKKPVGLTPTTSQKIIIPFLETIISTEEKYHTISITNPTAFD